MSAITSNSPLSPNAVFAYGTLMQGQSHHSLLEPAGILSVQPASIAGELIDLGEYPALRLSPYLTSRVHGQVIEVEKLDTILSQLDDYEGPELKREIVNVTLDNGHNHPVWTWVLASEASNLRVIPSGRWGVKAAGG